MVVSQKLPFATSFAKFAPIKTETGSPPRASWTISDMSLIPPVGTIANPFISEMP